ncbi:hypothetical protein Hypma_013545 [Hypsizygus marmoreus]|uniref:Uncharacterized protein n=1 Tax=Hypsizygus marmoreus TaxID=39966 RepID=A0A369JI67_HYPMA|nr:hypothetical protein Hypma_013545 [Hypsizygus marmoreus]
MPFIQISPYLWYRPVLYVPRDSHEMSCKTLSLTSSNYHNNAGSFFMCQSWTLSTEAILKSQLKWMTPLSSYVSQSHSRACPFNYIY